jgi:hypothetical protein
MKKNPSSLILISLFAIAPQLPAQAQDDEHAAHHRADAAERDKLHGASSAMNKHTSMKRDRNRTSMRCMTHEEQGQGMPGNGNAMAVGMSHRMMEERMEMMQMMMELKPQQEEGK